MYGIVYICAFIGLLLSAAILALGYKYSGRFFGYTLSQWVSKTRRKNDEISAEKLRNVRKRLEVLAHDVIKHRLLGLHSLFEEMKRYYDVDEKKIAELLDHPKPNKQDSVFRDEFFRLCGIKARPEERLWMRWLESFNDIWHFTGKFLATPSADPMFANASQVLFELRRAMLGFVDTEKVWKRSFHRFSKIMSLDYINVYPAVLDLAAACRMEIAPAFIIQSAIEAVASQTRRADLAKRIHIYRRYDEKLLCDAPTRTLVMCLTRLIDNAIEHGGDAAVDVSCITDDFTGLSTLIIKVYDKSDEIPAAGSEGLGMRGVRQSLETFGGGIIYKPESRDGYRKAAVLSISAAPYKQMTVTKLRLKFAAVFIFAAIAQIGLFFICLFYVLGGPPVEFAGKGTDITEFYVEVGEQLSIPLCTGGRNVRAEVTAGNAACNANQCTFEDVLNDLKPCTKSLSDPKCPSALTWTPQFEDGQRQGRNYEISVKCIADGPPPSEDSRRIRVLVTRPNSAPKIILAQVINESKGKVHYVNPDQTIKVAVDDKIRLRILATDADSDLLIYRLRQPNAKTLISTDGTFILNTSWSIFGTSTFEVEITDNIAPPVRMNIVLEADTLHPIEMRTLHASSTNHPMWLACEGSAESRICHLPDNNANELSMNVWFDPLQPKIRPVIEFFATDNHSIYIRHVRNFASSRPESQLGDQWEIYSQRNRRLTAVLELANIEKLSVPGLYHFSFRILSNPVSTEITNMAVNMNISEMSGRMPTYKSLIILSLVGATQADFSFVSRHLEFTEYDNENDQAEGRNETWIYPNPGNHMTGAPIVSDIRCQTPDFEHAFETPVVHNLKNAWRIDFKLKHGCIPGLTSDLSAKQRLCTAEVTFDNKFKDDIWLVLQSRDCAPRIEQLTLTSTHEEIARNEFTYRFKIVDTDGNLPRQNITLRGTDSRDIVFDPVSDTLGSNYTGTVRLSPQCTRRRDDPIAISATDDTNLTTQKRLLLPQSCPPLISTLNGQTEFEIDEGTLIEIPIRHDSDVRPVLLSRLGTLHDDKFSWRASCSYGKGPHIIEIASESDNRQGDPLRLRLMLNCQPRFTMRIDGHPMTTGAPITIAPNQTRHIELHTDDSLRNFEFRPRTNSPIPKLSLIQAEFENTYRLDVTCNESGTAEELLIQIIPQDGSRYLRFESIRLSVQCTE